MHMSFTKALKVRYICKQVPKKIMYYLLYSRALYLLMHQIEAKK